MRIGFSLYAGWQTAATLLGVAQWLRQDVITDSSFEAIYGSNLIWIAWPVYILATLREEEPIYGAVWSWVLFAVISEDKSAANGVNITAWIVVIPHTLFILGYVVFLYSKYQGRINQIA